uniref:Protein kinase domain-containing protein n=1 Tax=Meloidogyne enterolobii TaxID=390850 RepID=A0A6V7X7C8_MELEN|nr:unnamed protein product [Meloidogyne enterolobii]CAD2196965.1 unnamed protein product [Meloidogyne enterolobii]
MYKRIRFSLIVTTPLSSQQRPSSFSTINSVPAARRPIYNQHCRSFFFAISSLLADNFVAMSVRPREGDLNVRAGFTFESERYTYKLEELIGDGGYGQVYEADAISKGKKQDTKRLAVKLERRSGATDIEARVLETAKDKNCRHIPKIFDHGVIQSRSCSFIAMELKGRDLYRLRKDRNNGSFTLGTAVRVALVTLEAIRELHEVCGFISRDIKAGNFVTGQTTSDDIRNIYLIDFGLCRKYKDANNNIVAARPDVGWRGTTRYGSRSAHLHQDLARRDDVESWFYMIVEMTKGSLPWSAERDRAAVYKSKLAALSNLDDFLNGCPQGYRELIGPIIKLNFGDAPAYKEMGRVLERIITEQGIDKKGKMDWELAEEPEMVATGDQMDSFPTSTTQRRV